MKILLVGSGGVGAAFTAIAARRDFFELVVVADYDEARARAAVDALDDDRFVAARVDASSADDVAALCREHDVTHVMNAVDPRFVMSIFDGAFAAGADYLDMAMSLSVRHPEEPYAKVGKKLGDDQFAVADQWESAGRLALVGMGVEPGLSDVFARYAADHLFSEIRDLGTRDGANLAVHDEHGNEVFAPSFSIWTTIEECLNPPVVWERARADEPDGGWFVTPPFSEPEVFDFPEGIGPVECVNVEHEEVLLMPRWVDAERVTFKYGLGEDFINVLKALHDVGLDSTTAVRVPSADGPVEVSPRDVVRLPARPRDHRPAHDRQDLRRALDHRHRQGRAAARDVPVPRRRQRVGHAGVRAPVRRVADRREPGGRARAARGRHLERRGGARPRGLRRRAVPGAAHRLRLPVGPAGLLILRRP
jgi:saccharopine dehydrogenase-like NADP-dependent oxidoreductase